MTDIKSKAMIEMMETNTITPIRMIWSSGQSDRYGNISSTRLRNMSWMTKDRIRKWCKLVFKDSKTQLITQ